jgi:hypothetical protein
LPAALVQSYILRRFLKCPAKRFQRIVLALELESSDLKTDLPRTSPMAWTASDASPVRERWGMVARRRPSWRIGLRKKL